MNHPSKLQLTLTFVAILSIGCLIYTQSARVSEIKPNNTITETPTLEPWTSTEVKKEGISESTDQYSISAHYPITKDDRITTQFKNFVDEQITQFKNDTEWANNPDIAPAQAQTLSLDIDYRNDKSKNADNYVFTVLTYTGGAHGLQATKTFSYDINGKLIKLSDLFTTGESGLKTISTFVIRDLIGRSISDSTWINEGASPNSENYQNFTISEDGLTFIFDPYQVAPYSAGAQNVTVPLTNFKNIANPNIFK